MSSHGTFCWTELNTPDVEAAKSFFAKTIGWTYMRHDTDNVEYWLALNDGVPIAGIVHMTAFTPPGVPPHWFSYLAVDDVEARVVTAEKAGATIIRPVFEVAGVGKIAILKDPTGSVMGWMTPLPRSNN